VTDAARAQQTGDGMPPGEVTGPLPG